MTNAPLTFLAFLQTPIAEHQGAELSTKVAVVPILRAGLGMVRKRESSSMIFIFAVRLQLGYSLVASLCLARLCRLSRCLISFQTPQCTTLVSSNSYFTETSCKLLKITSLFFCREGMYRNKHSLLPVQYYNKLPKECNVEVAIVLEPVIATGKAP